MNVFPVPVFYLIFLTFIYPDEKKRQNQATNEMCLGRELSVSILGKEDCSLHAKQLVLDPVLDLDLRGLVGVREFKGQTGKREPIHEVLSNQIQYN